MTYRIARSFGEFTPGQYVTDPAWPAANLKALISQRYIVPADPPKPEGPEVETRKNIAKAGRRTS